MNPLRRVRHALLMGAAIAVVPGLASADPGTVRLTGFPAQPDAQLSLGISANLTGAPLAGVQVWLSLNKLQSEGGKVIAMGRTDRSGKITPPFTGFTNSQRLCLEWMTQPGSLPNISFSQFGLCFDPGILGTGNKIPTFSIDF